MADMASSFRHNPVVAGPAPRDTPGIRSLLEALAPRKIAADGDVPEDLSELLREIAPGAAPSPGSGNDLLLMCAPVACADELAQALCSVREGGLVLLLGPAAAQAERNLANLCLGQEDSVAALHLMAGALGLVRGPGLGEPTVESATERPAEPVLPDVFRYELESLERQRDALEDALSAVQADPLGLLKIRIGYRLLTWLSRQRWLISARASGRLARSAAKRDPRRILLHDIDAASRAALEMRGDYWLMLEDAAAHQAMTGGLAAQAEALFQEKGTRVSVILVCEDSDSRETEQTLASLEAQTWRGWQLCAVGPLALPLKRRWRAISERQVSFVRSAGAGALEQAQRMATGDWILRIEPGDILHPEALFRIAEAAAQVPAARFLYSDEDRLDARGRRCAPRLKPEWNPELLLSTDYVGRLAAYRGDLMRSCGGLRSDHAGAEDYELALRATAGLASDEIRRVPRVLCHRPLAADRVKQACPEAQIAGARALRAHLQDRGRQAVRIDPGLLPLSYRIRWDMVTPLPHVTLIMPMKDRVNFGRIAVESILSKTRGVSYDLLIVDNGSERPETLEWLETVQVDPRVNVLRDHRPFNYSALNNAAVARTEAPLIGLINNDIEPLNGDWLAQMAALAKRSEIGCVGAKLHYPDGRIQHGGVILGMGGVAGHPHHLWPGEDAGYCGRLMLRQQMSAVTAACLLVRRETYLAVGGMNETDLKVAFNDVDFCLKVQSAGFRNCWTPFARPIHHESVSRGTEDSPEKRARFQSEIAYMQATWHIGEWEDPAYHPALSLSGDSFQLRRVEAGESLATP